MPDYMDQDELIEAIKRYQSSDVGTKAREDALGVLHKDFDPYITAIATYGSPPEFVEDRKQSSMIGFLNSLETFNPERGSNYKYHLICCIWNAIKKYCGALDTQLSGGKQFYAYKTTIHSLKALYGREPTEDEVADCMGLTRETVAHIKTAVSPTQLAEHHSYVESTAHEQVVNEEEDAYRNMLIKKMFRTLTTDERKLLKQYFWKKMTYAEIGALTGVSRQRVEQRIRKILGPLKDSFQYTESKLYDN